MLTAANSQIVNLMSFSKFCCTFQLLSTDEDVFVCSGIRSVSFYEHIVTVGTGLGSLLFYDIRAQRFLEKPLNLNSGYRKCPGEGILKLTTGTGWVVRSPFRLYPAFSQPALTSALVSESRRDVEELLLRCSFLPQRGLHALLRQLWHQVVCGGRASVFRPARQLRRAVELASCFSSISLHPYNVWVTPLSFGFFQPI